MRRWALALMVLAALVALAAVAWAGVGFFARRGVDGATEVLASPPTAGHASAAPNADLASAINDFGFDLLRATEASPTSGGSVVISPLSLHVMLSMLQTGARGTSAAQMRRVLHTSDLDPSTAQQSYADLLVRLGQSEKGKLAIANSLWTGQKVPIEQSFIDTDRKYFGAEARSVDLGSRSAMDEINTWVAKNTGGKIPTILDSPLPPYTASVLLNATYFLDMWETPFDKAGTQDADFHLAGGSTIKAKLMQVHDSFEHTKTADYEAIRLPYKDSDVSMIVVLPSKTSSLAGLVGSLDASSFAGLGRSMETGDGTLRLPRVETTWGAELAGTLKRLGMPDVFSADSADLSGMTAVKPAWLDRVVHRTYLRVDEQGTEAAAVSLGVAGATAIAPRNPFSMTVDRPYLMAIVDNTSGATLFLAAVSDPTR
ncbi:MAG: serpin family protein [Coriobacteriia bacterium]|nr:serpin family protein [Coriobacteriia bacterium]